MESVSQLLRSRFAGKRIAILGDIVADQFLHGTIARVSREAPVFILRHDETQTLPGGAANAAVNVAALGGEPLLIGLAGDDAAGKLLLGQLRNCGVPTDLIVIDPDVKTTSKVRVLGGHRHAPRHQVIRIDYENDASISAATRQSIHQYFNDAASSADAIIISDYSYGMAIAESFEMAKEISAKRGIPLLIDSRFNLSDFPGATSATPNDEEAVAILGTELDPSAAAELCEKLGYEALLVTRGNKGMLLAERGKAPVEIPAVGSDQALDVTGAGDTVIAVYALGLASGLSFTEAAEIANHAGGIVVMKKGTASVSMDELIASLDANHQLSRSNAAD